MMEVVGLAFGIIRVQGMKRTDVAGIQIHDTREKGVSHTNEDIDFERSNLNYDLGNYELMTGGYATPNFTDAINERIVELDLKRAVRKDANVMAQIFVSATPEWLHGQTSEQQRQYFKNAYDWVCERYGKENIISAIVHMDEATPHMHVNLVPVTEDGRLSYEAHFNERKRGDLTKLQDDFYSHNLNKGYDLERGEQQTVGSKKKHLDVLDYKLQEQSKTVDELEHTHGQLKEKQNKELAELNAKKIQIASDLSELRLERQKLISDLNHLEGEIKTLTGDYDDWTEAVVVAKSCFDEFGGFFVHMEQLEEEVSCLKSSERYIHSEAFLQLSPKEQELGLRMLYNRQQGWGRNKELRDNDIMVAYEKANAGLQRFKQQLQIKKAKRDSR